MDFQILAMTMRSLPRRLVRTAGLEPTLPEGKQILSLLRLPISPRPHGATLALFVIPAKAGIHAAASHAHRLERRSWIPASAGMTGKSSGPSRAYAQTFRRSRISLPGLK